jgi:hypothetical protein
MVKLFHALARSIWLQSVCCQLPCESLEVAVACMCTDMVHEPGLRPHIF